MMKLSAPPASSLDTDPVRPSEAFAALLDHALADLPDLIAEVEASNAAPPPVAAPAQIAVPAVPDGLGSLDLPQRLDLLAALLAWPEDDFLAQDLLANCWPRRSGETSRAALAVALNLAHHFGRPERLPMACLKAWRLLDPVTFRPALVHRLATLCALARQGETADPPLLPLDYGEIELIEYLFETLDPGEDTAVMAEVMALDGLGDRRLALLRRIPIRARRRLEAVDPPERVALRPGLAQSRALLDHLGQTVADPTLAQAARHAVGDLDRLIASAASPRPTGDEPR